MVGHSQMAQWIHTPSQEFLLAAFRALGLKSSYSRACAWPQTQAAWSVHTRTATLHTQADTISYIQLYRTCGWPQPRAAEGHTAWSSLGELLSLTHVLGPDLQQLVPIQTALLRVPLVMRATSMACPEEMSPLYVC